VTPFAADAGLTAQGLTAQGLTAQGLTAQGLTAQGLTAQGLTAQGLTAQGLTAQGLTAQGLTAQGLTAQGSSLMGNDLFAPDIKGVAIKSVEMRGLTSGSSIQAHTMTRIPTMSTGGGNYISVGGATALNHYAVAHLVDGAGNPAEDIDLFIAGADKDPVPNEFHNFAEQDNEDELYVVYFFHRWSGEWISLCPYNPLTKSASAMAIPEDPANPDQFIFACTATGVASKCARNWGYRPWAETTAYVFDSGSKQWLPKTFPLKSYYDSCKTAAMAGYCQSGQSFTKAGTQVDLYDTQQIIWPNTIENPWNGLNPTSLWMNAQEYFIAADHMDAPFTDLQKSALQRSRYKELTPVSECDDFAAIDRLDHDHIEDGRWGALFKEVGTINVFSPTYCTHDEYNPGDALPWDCSSCTTKVCQTHPECCGSMGIADAWTPACAGYATAQCNDAAGQWAPGKVWPKNLPDDDHSIYPNYLLGPGGALLRADGVSGSETSATVSGWACDPEWPGAAVAVRIFAGGTADGGGTQIGEVRADQALAGPLATDVSVACDGPNRTAARHGFSFTLPTNQAGNVYLYAVDESTANGPPAPPTLLRNGVVQVPRCEHSEHVAGAALSASCSSCAASVCGDGTHDSCCTTAWTDACAAAADACAPADTSVTFNSRSFGAATTGWIEAPTTGTYVFAAAQQPSRLFVNGATVLDWFTTSPGTTSGSIVLQGGHRYSMRWDRLQTEPPATPGVQGLTWQPPATIGQVAIPSANLYAIGPGGTAGLSATFFQLPAFGGATQTRTDPNIDINKDIQPPSGTPLDLPSLYGPSYSAIWEGEIIPSFTESYNFYVVGSGDAHLYLNGAEVSFPGPPPSNAPPQGACGHDLCLTGPKLDSSCNSCAHDICAADPYCCNGGYMSYYSFLPEWDARCLAEVATYCPTYHCTSPAADPPISPSKKSDPVAMTAGVHYALRMTYDNGTPDKTIRLLWVSPRTGKATVPQSALQPPGPIQNGGSGLNVTYFATLTKNGTTKADGTAVASGMVADLSLTAPIGQLGMPVVDVLASPVDATSGQPMPPSVVRPRYGEEVFVTASGDNVLVSGIGGISAGAVRIGGGLGGDVIAAVDAHGDFTANVPVALGAVTLTLTQQTYPTAPPCGAGLCADSKTITWPITVTVKTASAKAPEILAPIAPVNNANPADTKIIVSGTGTPTAVHVTDQGPQPTLNIPDLPDLGGGTFSGPVTLDPGTPATPLKGWHKLVFDQGGAQSRAVFVSIGIDPPTVEFPRNGAEIDCTQPDPTTIPPARGTIPYPEDRFGPLRVFEETGRAELGDIGAQTRIIPPQVTGDPIRFEAFYNLSPGRHVLLFFQAPEPPPGATQVQRDEHFRGFSNLANTPQSRVVVDIKPKRFPIDPGQAAVFGGLRTVKDVLVPQLPGNALPLSIADCGPNANPRNDFCALPNADVNVRVGPKLFTTRADGDGAWSLSIPLKIGWNDVTLAQVADSTVGGAWSESCLSNDLQIGLKAPGGPTITVPADITVDATGPAGAQVTYPNVTAVRPSTGAAVAVSCTPQSGTTFPIGQTPVLCTSTDPDTGAVGLAEFAVIVVDAGPTITASDVLAEADQPHGVVLDSYPIVATSVVDSDLFLECVPPTPNLFLLDETTPVTCTVTDHFGVSASTQFTVKVVDTTPPTLCPLPDIMSGTNAGSGAFVTFATCAKDIVDGDITPSCDHTSGSFFPLGNTVVKCTASDAHHNSASDTFIVHVGDTTPPVLKMPTVVTAFATSKAGARVNYTVTATDNVDPNPKVVCTPPSGSLFGLGKTTVKCTATDSSGNPSQGTFTVKVIVAYGGLEPPIPNDGTGVFKQGSTIPVKFTLIPPSDGIGDLLARLYVAPIDAAGNVGPEKPAKGHGVSSGNVFSPTGNHYQLNMDTGTMAVGRWQLRVDLGDLEQHTTPITLR
jgi:hypothetical protein